MSGKKLRWGIIGTGTIAHTFARGLEKSKTGRLVAVGSRNLKTAESFAQAFRVEKFYSTYEELLSDPDVDVVYISTPHPYHAEWCKKAAAAKKHILCEKPITLNHHQALEVMDCAKRHDVFLMEAYMYRCHPVTAKVIEIIQSRKLGEVKMIHANFSFNAKASLDSRLRNPSLGGGGILDVGGYTTSLARLVAGVALGKGIAEPLEVKALSFIGKESGIDEYAIAALEFEGGILAQLGVGISLSMGTGLTVSGTEGRLHVKRPFVPNVEGGRALLEIHRGDEKVEDIVVETNDWLYAIEADSVAEYIERREAKFPAPDWNDTLGNMRVLDRWREEIGLKYGSE